MCWCRDRPPVFVGGVRASSRTPPPPPQKEGLHPGGAQLTGDPKFTPKCESCNTGNIQPLAPPEAAPDAPACSKTQQILGKGTPTSQSTVCIHHVVCTSRLDTRLDTASFSPQNGPPHEIGATPRGIGITNHMCLRGRTCTHTPVPGVRGQPFPPPFPSSLGPSLQAQTLPQARGWAQPRVWAWTSSSSPTRRGRGPEPPGRAHVTRPTRRASVPSLQHKGRAVRRRETIRGGGEGPELGCGVHWRRHPGPSSETGRPTSNALHEIGHWV